MSAVHDGCLEAATLHPTSVVQVHACRGNQRLLAVMPRSSNEIVQLPEGTPENTVPEGERQWDRRPLFIILVVAALVLLLIDSVLPHCVDKSAMWWKILHLVVSVAAIIAIVRTMLALTLGKPARRGYTTA
ncbi:hypothetical protein MRX96_000570 [Rhipicephalus microplus]